MIQLTLERTKQLLAEAVAEKGADYVYTTPDGEQGNEDVSPNCFYVHGFQPGCIVGHVLHKAGVSLASLREEESNNASGVLSSLRPDLPYEPGVDVLLNEAQQAQDQGVPWGEAVRLALQEV